MKKFIMFFLISFFIFSIMLPVNLTNAENEKNYYAKVQSTGVQFCSSPSENSSLFEIPYSYFVKVESIVDDYFKATYKDVEGYVKKDKVKLMNGIPQVPYAQATYKLFVPYSMYASASNSSATITKLDENTDNVVYYGTKSGQQVSSNNNSWYYSSLNTEGQVFHGYVFSGVTDYLSKINVNNESFEIVDEGVLDTSSSEFNNLSVGTKVMLIVAISIPSLLILYFLIKPSKIMQITKNSKQIKKENKKIRHGDYFEFDESEL